MNFEPARLAEDLEHCLKSGWISHFNQRDYTGDWTSIALRSTSGASGDIASVPGSGYRNTSLLAECPYFTEVLATFQCEMESVRLLRLGAGSVILEHCDPGASYAEGFFRLHIPISSNGETHFVVAGHEQAMLPGECWYANFGLPHSVRNEGATDRVHLVIDGLRNDWSDRVFAAGGYDFNAEANARRMDADTRRQVIEALRARGTETDLRLAADLDAE